MSKRHDHVELSQSAPVTEALNARTLSRRGFLVIGGGAVLAAGLDVGGTSRLALAAETPSYTLDLARPADMLRLRFDFYNLVLSTGTNPPQLVRQDASAASKVAVTFTSQHVMEETVFEADVEPPLPGPGNVATKAVGPSRVVFDVPSTVKSLPYTEDGLFAWWQWVMRVAPRAIAPGPAQPPLPPIGTKPGDDQTDLLLVDWLHLSPDHTATWSHAARPVTRGSRTELWHTRLATRATDGAPALFATGTPPTVRALAADPAQPGNVFKALRPQNVESTPEDIVKQTTDYAPGSKQAPVKAELVLLSAPGASLELAGEWEPPLATAKWEHRSWLGRDNYVRVETRGFLYPFGNRASLISESQRKFASDGTAYLFQRQFIVIREPVKNYPDASGYHPYGARQFPFRQIRLTTRVTPNLPADRDEILGSTRSFWIPKATGGDLPFPVVALDHDGHTVELTCSLAWVHTDEAHDHAAVANLVGAWSKYDDLTSAFPDERRIIALNGQKVAMVPPTKPGETTFIAGVLSLGATRIATPDKTAMLNADLPNFFPTMLALSVRMPALEGLEGDAGNYLPTLSYDPTYVQTTPAQAKATAVDPTDLYARVQYATLYTANLQEWLANPVGDAPNVPIPTGFPNAATGGVALPNLSIGALSKEFGPLSGSPEKLSELQQLGTFDPKDFFDPENEALKLLGSIPLNEVLEGLDIGQGGGGPKILTRVEYENDDRSKPPIASMTTLDWAPKLKDQELPGGKPGPFEARGNGEDATLELHGEFRTDFKTGERRSKITGRLRNFTIHLVDRNTPALNFLAVSFTKFDFEQHNDAKPKLDPELSTVVFKGPLNFVNTLQKFLQTGGMGPAIDVQPSGVTVSYTLALPNIGIGVFSLRNLSFSAGLTLPFDNRPIRARFGFCSREQKFLVSVYVFAGGGFFALELGPDGLIMLEAAIEFGGSVALDLVVASGSVTVMAGIYFKMENKADGTHITLTGYLRATGRVSVLGLITITAEFYLGLSYTSEPGANRVEGEASLTVSIDILFFSASVTLRVRKQFAGPASNAAARALGTTAAAQGQPEFADLMSPSDWNTYCDSFAA